jgi:glycyl-tRNA synthetase
LTPQRFVNPNYSTKDYFIVDDRGHCPTAVEGSPLALRPETTMGSYAAAKYLLTSHLKIRMPLVVWQHGKSFRREQDQPTKHMRLKEFYQLEFQIMYSPTTKNDYSIELIPTVREMVQDMIGPCRIEDSDRIPNYALWTKDVVCEKTGMEVCSISRRTDFDLGDVLEVAIGTDRCVHNFLIKSASATKPE